MMPIVATSDKDRMIPRRILLVRNDKLGDFMLAWPAIRLLKEALPDTELYVLVPAYTKAIAALCPWIDDVVIDRKEAGFRGTAALTRDIEGFGFDGIISLFSTSRVAAAAWWAGIPVRVAPATKLAQIFYNARLKQRRSRSEKPEYVYNLDLARHYLKLVGLEAPQSIEGPFLHFAEEETAALSNQLRSSMGLSEAQALIFVHPGSGGSATNLSARQYGRLCRLLSSCHGHGFVITAGPGEEARAKEIARELGESPVRVLSSLPLPQLARHIQTANLFISGSTGPLHIAGALDRPTAGFYPGHRSGSPLRWRTLNRPENRLAFSPPPDGEMEDVTRIDVDAAAMEISNRFL